jgi:hypothetical protein
MASNADGSIATVPGQLLDPSHVKLAKRDRIWLLSLFVHAISPKPAQTIAALLQPSPVTCGNALGAARVPGTLVVYGR